MKFLVAIDGSEHSTRALEYALEVAAAAGASVTVVTAVSPNVYTASEGMPMREAGEDDRQQVMESIEDAEERSMEVLDRATEVGADYDVTLETEALYGDPVEVVPDFADEQGFDAIYVGHQGLPERYERVLGSVAKSIVERATVPVTVVQ